MSIEGGCCLDIDAGNTRLKWRLSRGEQVLASGVADTSLLALEQELARLDIAPERCRLASVAGEASIAAVEAWAQKHYSVNVEVAQVTSEACGLINSYEQPERMGIDRWLAAVAAYGRSKSACLVVDCGSAVTIELISADGRHQGGYIVPGLGLMRRSLFKDTDAVKVSAASLTVPLTAGKNTEDAVNHGLVLMIVGLVEKAQAEMLSETSGRPPVLWVTGGDGEVLLPYLPDGSRFDAHLVLDGLARLIP